MIAIMLAGAVAALCSCSARFLIKWFPLVVKGSQFSVRKISDPSITWANKEHQRWWSRHRLCTHWVACCPHERHCVL